MKFCTACGEAAHGQRFCTRCGAVLRAQPGQAAGQRQTTTGPGPAQEESSEPDRPREDPRDPGQPQDWLPAPGRHTAQLLRPAVAQPPEPGHPAGQWPSPGPRHGADPSQPPAGGQGWTSCPVMAGVRRRRPARTGFRPIHTAPASPAIGRPAPGGTRRNRLDPAASYHCGPAPVSQGRSLPPLTSRPRSPGSRHRGRLSARRPCQRLRPVQCRPQRCRSADHCRRPRPPRRGQRPARDHRQASGSPACRPPGNGRPPSRNG
jgi:hypothetical protein